MDSSIQIQTPAEKCYEAHKRGCRDWYARNKDKVSSRMKGWYLTNKETIKEYKRNYYLKRKEELNTIKEKMNMDIVENLEL
jgi:sarcosine oxidase delta subunit